MKRKIYFGAKKYLSAENIRFTLLLIPLTVVLVSNILHDTFDLSNLLDTNILLSFIIISLCELIAHLILHFIEKKCEDNAKLITDYDSLVKKYSSENLITYNNTRFPVVCLFQKNANNNWNIDIDDHSDKYYKLPSQVADFSQDIMKVHSQSVLYNQINIRLDNVTYDKSNNSLQLVTSRTFYFDSMLTNRACDFVLNNGKTIREIYEPGPYIQPLNRSKMSNHLGFNGFVMTSDDKIPFVMRGDNLSIGKGTLANSIGASLKTKYAISHKNDYTLTTESLGYAVLCEIIDELGLKEKDKSEEQCILEIGLTNNEVTNSIISIYRDLVECGKPQFLFFAKLKEIDSETLTQRFNKKNNKTASVQDSVKRDGKQIIMFTLEQLQDAIITPSTLTIKADGIEYKYSMMPSASASIVMMLDYLGK